VSIVKTADAVLPFEAVFNPDALFIRPARAPELRAGQGD